jgi:hypothetical protein
MDIIITHVGQLWSPPMQLCKCFSWDRFLSGNVLQRRQFVFVFSLYSLVIHTQLSVMYIYLRLSKLAR